MTVHGCTAPCTVHVRYSLTCHQIEQPESSCHRQTDHLERGRPLVANFEAACVCTCRSHSTVIICSIFSTGLYYALPRMPPSLRNRTPPGYQYQRLAGTPTATPHNYLPTLPTSAYSSASFSPLQRILPLAPDPEFCSSLAVLAFPHERNNFATFSHCDFSRTVRPVNRPGAHGARHLIPRKSSRNRALVSAST